MSRQDANAAFARTSFLYGGNAAYLEQLQARYEVDPQSVDAEWQAFFQSLKDDRSDVARNADGPSWQPPRLIRADGELLAALTGDWGAVETIARRQDQEQGSGQRRRNLVDRRAAGDAGFDPRADADPCLPHPRSLPRQPRSARPRAGKARGGARSSVLRLHRSRSRSSDLPRQGAGPGIRDRPRDARDPAPHLLPDARRRVHAHLRPGAEGVDAGAHRRSRQGDQLHPRGQARHPEQARRSRRLREVLRSQVHRHQALRPRRRRVDGPGA